jgi:hypothetical protein
MAELLFAMSGEEIQYSAVRPPVGDIEVRQASQQTSAEWMSKRNVKNSPVDVYD